MKRRDWTNSSDFVTIHDLYVNSNIFEAGDIKIVQINYKLLTFDLETQGHVYSGYRGRIQLHSNYNVYSLD